jgi:hypothetical protein
MVLDNWGTVDRWIAEEKITSRGPSGIGFVNFGTINSLQVNAPIETFGHGARGFNVYTGSVKDAARRRDRAWQWGQPAGTARRNRLLASAASA